MEWSSGAAKGYLMSRIEVNSRVITDMDNVKKKLEVYPNLKRTRCGACLNYILGDEETRDHFYTIEINRTNAAIVIYAKITPVYFLQEALLRFLNIMQIVSKDYEIGVAGIYPYFVLALGGKQINQVEKEEGRSHTENSDILLAKRLIQLLNENKTLREAQRTVLNKSRRLLQRLIVLESANSSSVEEIVGRIGLNKEEVASALESMPEIGYRTIYVNSNRFNLVKM